MDRVDNNVPQYIQPDLPSPCSSYTQKRTTWDCLEAITHLLQESQELCNHTTKDVADYLCRKVGKITHEKTQLVLQKYHGDSNDISYSERALLSVWVGYGEKSYGNLYVASDEQQPLNPAIPLETALLLAHICGFILGAVELSFFIQGQRNHPTHQTPCSLTKRERDVFTLMYFGYSQQDIAKKLDISLATVFKYRQHIYEQLGVHNETDALLMGYRLGLVSIFNLSDEEKQTSSLCGALKNKSTATS